MHLLVILSIKFDLNYSTLDFTQRNCLLNSFFLNRNGKGYMVIGIGEDSPSNFAAIELDDLKKAINILCKVTRLG